MKMISIMVPCYNEKSNIMELYQRIVKAFSELKKYDYEIIFADNASQDGSIDILKDLAQKDNRVKVIVNNRNFGVERSSTNAFLQCYGDAAIIIASDLQDPPELIPEFIRHWEAGYKLVLGKKQSTEEKYLIKNARKLYYALLEKISDNGHIKNVTGYGLYDKSVMDMLRWLDDPLPYTRGIICYLGYSYKLVEYGKNERKTGKSSYNYYR